MEPLLVFFSFVVLLSFQYTAHAIGPFTFDYPEAANIVYDLAFVEWDWLMEKERSTEVCCRPCCQQRSLSLSLFL